MENLNPDLTQDGVTAFFHERDPALVETIAAMEKVETWTLDKHESVQKTLQALAEKIEDFDLDEIEGHQHNKLIILLGYISSGKALKLLMWIEHNSPNFVARTLAEAQMLSALDRLNEGAARLFVERFEVLERMHVLSRIFSEERLHIVQRVLKILAGEDADEIGKHEGEESYA